METLAQNDKSRRECTKLRTICYLFCYTDSYYTIHSDDKTSAAADDGDDEDDDDDDDDDDMSQCKLWHPPHLVAPRRCRSCCRAFVAQNRPTRHRP